jgi:hypothetical protein
MHPVVTTALEQVVSADKTIRSSLSNLGITTVEQLLQVIYRFLRFVTNNLYSTYKRYTEGNGTVKTLTLNDTALTDFFMIINALKLSFFSFKFKELVVRSPNRSDDAYLEALKTKIRIEATENEAKLKAAKKRVKNTAVPDEDDLNEDDKISEYSEQLYALPYLSSDEIKTFLNEVRGIFHITPVVEQFKLDPRQLSHVISNIIIPWLNRIIKSLPTPIDSDAVASHSGGTRHRRHRKRRRTNRNKSPRRISRYNYNNKNNKKKTNRIRRYV